MSGIHLWRRDGAGVCERLVGCRVACRVVVGRMKEGVSGGI